MSKVNVKQVSIDATRNKKTKKKIVTQWINSPLIKLNNEYKPYYMRAYYCSNRLHQEGDNFSARYCNCRTCITCNSIRTAHYLNVYGEQLKQLSDPYLLTLTSPTVKAHNTDTLRYFINEKENIWRKIYQNTKNYDVKLKGIRTMEITSRPDDKYHIHFHFIIEQLDSAKYVLNQWLKHYPNANRKAQDLRKVTTENGIFEVLKYGTKFVTKFKDKQVLIPAENTDLIIRSLHRKRLINTFGGIRKVEIEDVNDVVEKQNLDLENLEYGIWDWLVDNDWYNNETGEKFSTFDATTLVKLKPPDG